MSQNAPKKTAIDARWLKKRKDNRELRRQGPPDRPALNINSLMDAFVIILCFLLKSFAADPVQIRESENLHVPRSNATDALVDALVIGVTSVSIAVNDVKVLDLRDGHVDESMMQDGSDGMLIQPLYEALKEKVNHFQMLAARSNRPFEGKVLIAAHDKTSYRLITEVMHTAAQAELEKFKFVAAEGKHPA